MTKRLSAVSEDGTLHTIVQMENGGEIDFVMDSGWAVKRRTDGTFQISETGEILRIVGP